MEKQFDEVHMKKYQTYEKQPDVGTGAARGINFQLVQCTARWLNTLKSPALMFKLDITKAFDTVDWAFLLQIMIKLGFGPRWTAMVVGLLSKASTRVLVNGAAGDLIYNRRGLRQGDPLSPLLFDSVMEALHLLLQRPLPRGCFRGSPHVVSSTVPLCTRTTW
jgi:hypothetical protein